MSVTPEFNFYALCARDWAVTYDSAKVTVLGLYLRAGAAAESVVYVSVCGYPSFERVALMQPLVLQRIPSEARFEALRHYGIVLGEN